MRHQNYLASRWKRYLHLYLFFRIPLLRPDNFLNKTYPVIKQYCSRALLYLILVISLFGIYFVSQQWDAFVNTFLHFFTLQGAFLYLVALTGTKIIHEMGHAYTAKHYGCKVPSMGIAFMVMIPMLYSDMTDTWRLKSKKARIHIAMAGMINELILAGICLFIWSFLPDGTLKGICFVIATTSLISTLLINVTPFMRFDGYYILSDWWGIDNLQQRAFQLAQWKLRVLLFGAVEEKPEQFLPGMEIKLICYAWLTWIYRFFLFIGIALLVYHLFFKLLGLILFFVEIFLLIVMPIFKELKYWWKLKDKPNQKKRLLLLSCFTIGFMSLLLVPWQTRVSIPGVLTSETYATMYPAEPAQIVSINIKPGQKVKKAQVLMVLASPYLDKEIEVTQTQLALFKLRAMRAVTNQQDMDDLQVIMEQIATASSKLQGLKEKQNQLTLRAPFSGVIAEMDHNLNIFQWVNHITPLCLIINPDTPVIKSVISEHELDRIKPGQQAYFYPDDFFLPRLSASIKRIDETHIKNLELNYLASQYGGTVAVKNHENNQLVPENTVYAIWLNNISPTGYKQEIKGSIVIQGRPISIAARIYEMIVSVMIRESGF